MCRTCCASWVCCLLRRVMAESVSAVHLHALNHLRALAALAVVFAHWLDSQQNFFPDTEPLLPEIIGVWGVDIFFVISGVVMVYISRSLVSGWMNARQFWVRRIIRVVPGYWASTVAAAFLTGAYMIHVSGVVEGINSETLPLLLDSLLHSLLFIEYRSFPINAVGWTLHYEMFFYFLFGVLLLLGRPGSRAFIVALVIALLVIGGTFVSRQSYLGYITKPIILEFAAGALLGHWLCLWLSNGARQYRWAPGLLAAGVLLLLAANHVWPESYLLKNRWWCWGIPAVMIVGGSLLCWPLQRKGNALSYWLGDASYSIYLWHLPTFYLVALVLHLGFPEIEQPVLWFLLVSLPLALAVSALCYYGIERPLWRGLVRVMKV